MTAEEFINKINLNFPTIEQIVKKFSKSDISFNERKAMEYRNRRLIKKNEKNILYTNDLEYLIYNTNISSIGIGAITFFIDFEKIDESFHAFASYNDFYKFCFYRIENKIVCFPEDSENYEVISTSIDQFLSFLYIYEQFDRNFMFGDDLPKSELKYELRSLIENGFSKSWVNELIIIGLGANIGNVSK